MEPRDGFLQHLTPQERSSLEPVMRSRRLRKGDRLFEQDDVPEHFFYIKEGTVKVTRASGNGREVILELLFPGDICGALCTLDGRPYSVRATFLQNGEAARIHRDHFVRLAAEHPGLVTTAVRFCQEKMRQQRRMMVGMAVERAEQRAARALLLLASRLGVRGSEGVRAPMVLDRQEFAEFIGTTVETAIRVLGRLRKEGLIQEKGHQFLIRDEEALIELAGLEEHLDRLPRLPDCPPDQCATCQFASDCGD
ncbi:MAG TPA: Crp/Fnr family transcriptional regulator [Candidatus Nitrosotenuis sp.]|jgi:CRP/FNR family transcriptional regulator|nr:Crp/Fnr family transcriptional regulator [Candidatus Nitrosotenuis sp.]